MAKTHRIPLSCDMPGEIRRSDSALIRKTIRTALALEDVATACEVNVLLTDDAGIRAVNLEQRGIDSATDVLSFPMFEYSPGHPPANDADADPATGLTPLGDMVISMERAHAQALEYGHTARRELCYLVVHSTLHLLGYDHLDEGEQKARMRKREEAILEALDERR